MINLRKFKKSVHYASRGLSHIWRAEQNFRIQTMIGLVVIIAGILFKLSLLKFILLVLLITLVLVLEILNTFFEKLVDLLSPRVHEYVGMLKDILAASVFVASIGAAIVGILIFWPSIF